MAIGVRLLSIVDGVAGFTETGSSRFLPERVYRPTDVAPVKLLCFISGVLSMNFSLNCSLYLITLQRPFKYSQKVG